MQNFNSKNKQFSRSTDSDLVQSSSDEDIEKELQEKLASLGINLSGGSSLGGGRATGALPSALDDKRTTTLDIAELRNALKQQISIAEIKTEIEKTIRKILGVGPASYGETQELELKAAMLMLPYCKEYIPDFPQEVRPAEFAVDLNLQDIIDFHSDVSDLSEVELNEMIEQYAVQVIQTLLSHPLIPQKDAKKIGVDLKTTALKDERGTAMYSSGDAQFLEVIFGESKLLERGGEVGLLAILISAKKWNKIDSETLFNNAVLYTLEAMAKKRGVPGIVLRSQGSDHPLAYILGEYIVHCIDQSLESLIKFVEEFITVTNSALNSPEEEFLNNIYHNYLPKLKVIFRSSIHESFDRFIETFRREYQNSQQSIRSKIFFLKRVGDLCELSFYTYEAISVLQSASGEVYAKENLDEGTKHYARRNNIPLDESLDILSQKNTLSELLLFTLKQRCSLRDNNIKAHLVSKLMNDTLFFLDSLRRVFDHGYARGRATSSNDYSSWEEVVADCLRGYGRLFFGRNLNDMERYHFENIYRKLLEKHLSFFELQSPALFSGADFKLEKLAKTKSSEDSLKEKFLHFLIAFHQALLNFNPEKPDEIIKIKENLDVLAKAGGSNVAVQQNNTAAFTLEAVQTRVLLSQSELPLSDYTIEALLAAVTTDAKEKTLVLQALRASIELSEKATIGEEFLASINFLQNLRQRISLIIILSEQEKEQWNSTITASIKDLEQGEPIELSSYGIVLSEIDEWELSEERILSEWKNPETTISRVQQILFILLLKRSSAEMQNLIEQYQRWISLNTLPSSSVRRRVFEKRLQILLKFSRQSSIKINFLKILLSLMRYAQLSYQVTNWDQPEAYLLEDLLAVETPIRRVQQIDTILSTKEPEKVQSLVQKFSSVLQERFQQSASGYSYYTDEERTLMESRLRKFELISKRTAWQATKERWLFSLGHFLVKPVKKISNQEEN